MTKQKTFLSLCFWLFIGVFFSLPCLAERSKPWARFSFFTQASQKHLLDDQDDFLGELIATFTLRSEASDQGGFEYAIDTRVGGYSGLKGRRQSISIYEAYVGLKSKNDVFSLRTGHVWLNEIGGLGSLAGITTDVRIVKSLPFKLGTLRLGLFGGFEPKILEPGYIHGVKKFGGYIGLDGGTARRHIIGYTNIKYHNLTERSVLLFSNYISVKRSFFLYQAAEYDLRGPAGLGTGGLTYFFTNLRYSPWSWAEIQGTYHRGRSLDTRTISEYVRTAQPVKESLLEGFLFESLGGRLTLRPFSNVHVFVGYARDKGDVQEEKRNRLNFGLSASNLFSTGFDLRASLSRYQRRAKSSSNSWYFSLGRPLGRSFYFEFFYYYSVAILKIEGNVIAIKERPHADLFGFSSIIHITRQAFLFIKFERMIDNYTNELRGVAGITYRL